MPLFGSAQPDNSRPEPPRSELPAPLMSKPQQNKGPATMIAKGVRLEGEFKSQGDVVIEGEVLGTIQTDGLLSVGSEAVVKAGITASAATIAGKIYGNSTIKGRLELKSTARITGDIVCQTISVESGAVMQGNLKCGVNSDPAQTQDQKVENKDIKSSESFVKPEEIKNPTA